MATLWALAALAVLAAYIDRVVSTDVEHALMARRSIQSELDLHSIEATLIYLLATGRMNHRGLILEEEQRFPDIESEDASLPNRGDGELGMAGEVYAGFGETRFAVQDEAGLVSVNAPQAHVFAALLNHVGVAASDIEQIVARTEDYIDSDSVLRLNGAERYEYERRAARPPLNWIMASATELKRVLGVDNMLSPAQWQRLRPLLSMRPVFGYNFNTMPPEVLAAVIGVDGQGIRGVVEEREKRPIFRLTTIALLSGRHLDIDEMEIRVLPSRFARIAVWHEDTGSRSVTGIALTPLGDRVPWRRDYRYSEPIPAGQISGAPRGSLLEAPTALLQ